MPLLRLNTDQGYSTVSAMRNTHSQMEASINQLSSAMAALQSEWESSAAYEFQGQYEGLRSQIRQQAEALFVLAQKLEAEIREWEAAAQSF